MTASPRDTGPAVDWPPGFEFRPRYLPRAAADALFATLREELAWRQRSIRLFGRAVREPRLTCWIGDEEAVYRYSGVARRPGAWHPALAALRRRLQCELAAPFNSVLCNAYRDGCDSMGWHADDEPELGAAPVIASLSLGAERRFKVRPVGGGVSFGATLGHGSLLVMSGRSQCDYRHAVPKTRRPVGWRINLTFREVRPAR